MEEDVEHHGGEMLLLPHPDGSCCSSVSRLVSWCALVVVAICSGVVISVKMALHGPGRTALRVVVMVLRVFVIVMF